MQLARQDVAMPAARGLVSLIPQESPPYAASLVLEGEIKYSIH